MLLRFRVIVLMVVFFLMGTTKWLLVLSHRIFIIYTFKQWCHHSSVCYSFFFKQNLEIEKEVYFEIIF